MGQVPGPTAPPPPVGLGPRRPEADEQASIFSFALSQDIFSLSDVSLLPEPIETKLNNFK